MEKNSETLEEDRASLRSAGKTPTDGDKKESLGTKFRRSFRVSEKSPLSPRGKGSKVTPSANGSPPSPSPSTGSSLASPLKTIGELFLKRDEHGGEATPSTSKLTRSKTDPNMPSVFKRGNSIRRSLGFMTKKDEKNKKADHLKPDIEGLSEVKKMEEEEEEEEEGEELEESYTAPEIPHTPLSVMQISKLIEAEDLEEAHLNLLALRQEFQREREKNAEDSTMELAKKEKDLNLLYLSLRDKIRTIVRDSNSLPSRNKGLLVLVARIIQEEEKRAEEAGGLPDCWREAWGEAVAEGVTTKVGNVHLEPSGQNQSWLSVHLDLLGEVAVKDLECVKRELRRSYPPSFRVFSTYARSYHQVVGEHLQRLEQHVTELKDLYALLDWIHNTYKSERIMGSSSLQLEMQTETGELQLEEGFLQRLEEKCCSKVKEDMRFSLDRLTELDYEDVWKDNRPPAKDDENFLCSKFPMDVWTRVKGIDKNAGKIDQHLELKVISSCLEELKLFPRRFESDFKRQCGDVVPAPTHWSEYHITYINSFSSLLEHMQGYQDRCPGQLEDFRKEVKSLIFRFLQRLEDRFKEDVKPYLRRMMTRKWLNNDQDFKFLHEQTKLLKGHCELMKPPHSEELASRLHLHVVKEYVSQLVKNNYRCNNRKHERAADKIRQQCHKLRDLFDDMESSHEWLRPVGDDLSDIIGQRNKTLIKEKLWPLILHYPDFSQKHLEAVLNFRGLPRAREHQRIVRKFTELRKELKKEPGSPDVDRSRVLFGDMEVNVHTDCLSNLPLFCLAILRPDS